MVSREPISKRIFFLSSNIIQYHIHERSCKGIMNASIIQFLEIYADPYLILLILFLNYYGAYLIELLHQFNNPCCKHFIQLQVDPIFIVQVEVVMPLLNWLHVQF